ncbi:MAG TPA: cytochrome c biogenesis protein CcdA [Ktedonobacteraceae bacterium]|jgi:cytochrome c-type biogenesis protein|nr:cytochrome c biogenesis protein CcdA [Ktedonobacteraceae bacterium]
MSVSQLGLGIAFLAGLASFLSPCVLPLVPIYLAQLVGQSIHQADSKSSYETRLVTFLHAATFVLGFTLAFVALGASASSLGSVLKANQFVLRQVGGVILIVIGLHIAGIFKLPFLYMQKRFHFQASRPSYPASLLIGIIFGFAWTPCIGPILGSILVLAANTATLRSGVTLLLFYSLGLGVPFLLLGLGLNQVSRLLTWLKPHLGKIEIFTGILLIIVGLMILFNLFGYLSQYFSAATLFQ